ncbi:twin-arginine translocase TatA/TatE family subunit [Leucobacter soli]|uniref:Sec-independent protein translocase protein TatB n=2 Tax=Leucobacter soli TaxID=2812850 RepID=A0A916JVI8_9MICO|nr:Sec-independent protein translocase protein TatB [Leucobacter soli]
MGLTIDKILVILVIAMFLLGPDRLPMYAKKLGEFVRNVKHMADGAKDRLRDEMGPDFDDVDWKQLDPRQYDPRRIIRDALLEDEREAQAAARKARVAEAAERRKEAAEKAAGGDAADDAGGGESAAGADATAEAAAEASAESTAADAAGADASETVAAVNYDEEAT